MINYRKVYEQHYGPIPKDSKDRTYEIHHIDGNHGNNEPENLKAVSIQEHYDIHYSQGDWYACLRIAAKIKLPQDEISEIAKKNAQKRISNGNHHFITNNPGPDSTQRRLANGTHNLLKRSDGSSQSSDRVSNRTHHLLRRLDGSSLSSDRVADKTLNLLGGEIQRKTNQRRVADGTHHLLGPQEKVKCPHCHKIGGKNNMKRWHFGNCKFKK